MTNYGFVASGGGYRSFYTAGALVWLKKHDIPIVHIASTSSGNNITIDYLLWDMPAEDLPPVLTRTMRLSVTDIFQVFSNFLGLRPSLLPSGSHLFTVETTAASRWSSMIRTAGRCWRRPSGQSAGIFSRPI